MSESDGYGGINEKYFLKIDEEANISKIEEVLQNAEGKRQKIDVAKERPDYNLLIRYQNGETHLLHLVLGNTGEKSRILYIGHEINGFNISYDDTKTLMGILENQ